jgi:hypothetical protein
MPGLQLTERQMQRRCGFGGATRAAIVRMLVTRERAPGDARAQLCFGVHLQMSAAACGRQSDHENERLVR